MTKYVDKEIAIIFYGSIAFKKLAMIHITHRIAVFAGTLPSILKLPFELPVLIVSDLRHYLLGLGPNLKKIPQNSGKQIRIHKTPKRRPLEKNHKNFFFRGEFTT